MSQVALPDGRPSRPPAWTAHGGRLDRHAVSGVTGPVTSSLLPTWSIIPSRFWKAQVPYLAGTTAWSRSTAAAAAVGSPRRAPRLHRRGVRGRRPRGPRRHRHRARGAWSGSPGGDVGGHLAAEHPGPGARHRRDLARVRSSTASPRTGRERSPGTSDLDTDEGWAKYNKHYWRGRLRRLPRVLLRPDVHRAALHQADRGLRRLGARDRRRRRWPTPPPARLRRRGVRAVEPLCDGRQCPVLVVHGTDDRIRPHAYGERLAELTGGELVLVEGAGHGIRRRATRCWSTRLIAQFVDRVARRPPPPGGLAVAGPRPRPGRGAALYLSSPIGLGHARRDVASPPSCAACTRPADRLARAAPGHRVLAAMPARRCTPASAGWSTSPPTSRASRGEHDLHAFQAIRRMDEILVEQLHGVPRRPRRGALRPRRRRRGVGRRLLPPREPGGQAVAARLDDRLRRLAADARGRRRRGGADRRLQRGDDRAARPVPGGARPVGLRRQPSPTSSTTPFGPGLPLIRDWTSENFDYAGYVTGFEPTPPELRPSLRAASSATARTSGYASSPSVGRASVGRCCGGCSTRFRWSAPRPTTCGSSW